MRRYFKGRSSWIAFSSDVVPRRGNHTYVVRIWRIDVFRYGLSYHASSIFYEERKWKDQIRKGPIASLDYYHINQKIKPFDDVR